jgi:hypothetical protein
MQNTVVTKTLNELTEHLGSRPRSHFYSLPSVSFDVISFISSIVFGPHAPDECKYTLFLWFASVYCLPFLLSPSVTLDETILKVQTACSQCCS